jgi:hypothetical protein
MRANKSNTTPTTSLMSFRLPDSSPLHRIAHLLTDRQLHILQILSDGQPRSTRHLVNWLGGAPLKAATVRRDLTCLRRLRLIVSGGNGYGAYWRLPQTDTLPDARRGEAQENNVSRLAPREA